MQNKNWTVFWIKTGKKHATVHNLTCPDVEKQGKGERDPKGNWGYDWFNDLADAERKCEEYKESGFAIKTCRKCEIYRNL